ncbi:hypothetical protein STENM327S_02551 [Streptomyces tendae]
MGQVLTTASVPDRDKLAFWHDALGRALVPMTVVPLGDGPFAGRIAAGRVGHLRVCDINADAQRVTRTTEPSSRTPEGFIGFLPKSGTTTLVQDGRTVTAAPGDLLVYDTTRPHPSARRRSPRGWCTSPGRCRGCRSGRSGWSRAPGRRHGGPACPRRPC